MKMALYWIRHDVLHVYAMVGRERGSPRKRSMAIRAAGRTAATASVEKRRGKSCRGQRAV